MWQRDEEHMQKHIGVFEDGVLQAVVGIYPLPARIGDRDFLFATVGNMATRPEAEGKGYMSLLYTTATEELTRMGVDMARLGGARQRYERFGFTCGGSVNVYSFQTRNRQRCFPPVADTVTFRPIAADDRAALDFCYRLHHTRPFCIKRRREDLWLTMRNKQKTPWLALDGDTPIGYLCASENGRALGEQMAVDAAAMATMLCAWQQRLAEPISFALPPYLVEENTLFAAACEDMQVRSPSRYCIANWVGIMDALMKLRASYAPMTAGELTLDIQGYGSIHLYVRDGDAGCETAEGGIPLSPLEATRLLTDPMTAYVGGAAIPAACRAWFPLPLTWDTVDAV